MTNRNKHRKLLIADLFCGAGGTSTGTRKALNRMGLKFDLVAVNHWPVAIESHKKNHPEARHYCINLDHTRPIDLVPEGHLDLLLASPECIGHSRARGGRPVNDQSRMSCWHVIKWCTDLRVKTCIIENVQEFVEFGPLDTRTMRPVKSRKGQYFLAFISALENIGFRVDYRVLNAADYGDATTRERLFIIARSDGKPIRWPEPSHSRTGGKDLFGEKLKWRAARDIIDWELSGKSIFNRKKPLAEKTLSRIYAGALKFAWPEPYLVILRQHMTARSVEEPLPSLTAGGKHVGVVERTVEPLPADKGLTVSSFVLKRHGDRRKETRGAHSVDELLPPVITRGAGYLIDPVASAFVLAQGSGSAPRPVESPVPTIVGGGKVSLLEPVLVEVNHGVYEKGVSVRRPRSLNEPLPAITTKRGVGIAKPVLINMKGQSTASSVDEPTPTITAHAGHLAVCNPLISPYYGCSKTCKSVQDPLDTITAKERFGLVEGTVEPFLVPQFGEREGQKPRHHAVSDPLPAVTSHGAGALVEPSLDAYSFVVQTDQTGSNGGCVRSVDDPLFTTVTKQNTALIEPLMETIAEDAVLVGLARQGRLLILDGHIYKLDIRFRMLEPSELAKAMSFTDKETTYEFVGNKTEVTKQIGNAVPVRLACALVASQFIDLVQNGKGVWIAKNDLLSVRCASGGSKRTRAPEARATRTVKHEAA